MYPEKLWDYNYIAGNPNTTREYILEHYLGTMSLDREIIFDHALMDQLSQNINITVEDVLKHPNLNWHAMYIIKNRNFALDEVLMLCNSDINSFTWIHNPIYTYSANPRLTWEDVIARGIDEWNWYYIAQHPWVTESMLEDKQYPWQIGGFASNPNLTIRTIRDDYHNHLYINAYYASSNPGIKWKDIVDNPDLPWNWCSVTRNPNITLEIVRNNPMFKWDWNLLSCHTNITWDMIIEDPDLPWNKGRVSLNPNITWDIVRDNPEWPWDWVYLSKNKFTKYGRN